MEYHRPLDDELDSLRDRVLLLGGEAETALERAMKALIDRDTELAQQVLDQDDQIDRLEVEIDRQCIDIIALRQPAARDLRFVISVAKMAPVLERIADHPMPLPRHQRQQTLVNRRITFAPPGSERAAAPRPDELHRCLILATHRQAGARPRKSRAG